LLDTRLVSGTVLDSPLKEGIYVILKLEI